MSTLTPASFDLDFFYFLFIYQVFLFFKFYSLKNIYLFIYLFLNIYLFSVACGIQIPDQVSNPGPLY